MKLTINKMTKDQLIQTCEEVSNDIYVYVYSVGKIETSIRKYDKFDYKSDQFYHSVQTDLNYFKHVFDSNRSTLYELTTKEIIKDFTVPQLKSRLKTLKKDLKECQNYTLALFKIQSNLQVWLESYADEVHN